MDDDKLIVQKPTVGPGMPSDNPAPDPTADLRGAPSAEPTNELPLDDPSAPLRGVEGTEPVFDPLPDQEGTAGVRDAEASEAVKWRAEPHSEDGE
jgi:hypothetical protein